MLRKRRNYKLNSLLERERTDRFALKTSKTLMLNKWFDSKNIQIYNNFFNVSNKQMNE